MKESIFVDDITVDFLEARLPDVAASLRETGAKDARDAQASTIAEAVDAAATAERERILGIEAAALPGQEPLAAKLKADPSVTVTAAQAEFLAAEKAKRGSHLDALREDETSLTAPAPSSGSDAPTAGAIAKGAVELAVKTGAIQ